MLSMKKRGVVDVTTLTEEVVVFAFSKAWNRLVPNSFLDSLAPDARYASQWVFDQLVPPGGTHAGPGEFAGSDDFEVVAFMVILPEHNN